MYQQIIAKYPGKEEAKDAQYQRLINFYNTNSPNLLAEIDAYINSNPAAERADQAKLALTKAKDDLQMQVDDLSRTNRDKSTLIASLQSSVSALQERLAKSSKPVAAKAPLAKVMPKPAVKTAQKAPVKKKTLTKSAVH